MGGQAWVNRLGWDRLGWTDILRAVSQNRNGGDLARVFLSGQSAGAHLTTMSLITHCESDVRWMGDITTPRSYCDSRVGQSTSGWRWDYGALGQMLACRLASQATRWQHSVVVATCWLLQLRCFGGANHSMAAMQRGWHDEPHRCAHGTARSSVGCAVKHGKRVSSQVGPIWGRDWQRQSHAAQCHAWTHARLHTRMLARTAAGFIGVSGPYNLLTMAPHLHRRGLSMSLMHSIFKLPRGCNHLPSPVGCVQMQMCLFITRDGIGLDWIGLDGMGWDGMGWDGMGWAVMSCNVVACHGMSWRVVV